MTLLSYSTPALQHPRQPPQQYTFTAVPKTGSGVKISRPAPQQLERFADVKVLSRVRLQLHGISAGVRNTFELREFDRHTARSTVSYPNSGEFGFVWTCEVELRTRWTGTPDMNQRHTEMESARPGWSGAQALTVCNLQLAFVSGGNRHPPPWIVLATYNSITRRCQPHIARR